MNTDVIWICAGQISSLVTHMAENIHNRTLYISTNKLNYFMP